MERKHFSGAAEPVGIEAGARQVYTAANANLTFPGFVDRGLHEGYAAGGATTASAGPSERS
jgi:hypothetical protein